MQRAAVVEHQAVAINEIHRTLDDTIREISIRAVLRALRVLISGEAAVAIHLTRPGDEVRLSLSHVARRVGHGNVFHIKIIALTLQGSNVAEVAIRACLAPVAVIGDDHAVAALAHEAERLSLRQIHPLGVCAVLDKNYVATCSRRACIHGSLHRSVLARSIGRHD